MDEAIYWLAGTLTTTVDGEVQLVRPGDTVFIPRGRTHHHENPKSEAARAMVVLTLGSIGRRYFQEIAAEVNVPGKPDLARVKGVMVRHGLVPAWSSCKITLTYSVRQSPAVIPPK